jgi:hypothetical protein
MNRTAFAVSVYTALCDDYTLQLQSIIWIHLCLKTHFQAKVIDCINVTISYNSFVIFLALQRFLILLVDIETMRWDSLVLLQ